MQITSADILLVYSTGSGAARGNQTASTMATSLGGYMGLVSGTPPASQLTSNSTNNLFDNISGTQNENSQIDYKCVFVFNNHNTLPLLGTVVYVYSTGGGAGIQVGVDTNASSDKNSSQPQALTVDNDLLVPPGVSFSSPTTRDTAISLGDIGPQNCRAFWVKRTAPHSNAINNDGMVLRIEGDTGA